MQNPWAVESLYDFTYFHCPECGEVSQYKQDFVNHAFHYHPQGAQALYNVKDTFDIELPFKQEIDIKPDLNILEADQSDTEENNSGSGKTKCSSCKRTFAIKAHLRLHENNIHGIKVIKCEKCNVNFQSVSDLNQHFSECYDESFLELDCNKCDLKFKSTHLLILHLGLDHGVERPAVCDICGLILTLQKHLPRHKRAVHSDLFGHTETQKEPKIVENETENEFSCAMCKSSCASRVNLELHLWKKHEVCEFLCGNCGKIFQDVQSLNCHEVECNTPESCSFPCNKCEKLWNSTHSLALHLGVDHEIDKPAVCDICGQILCYQKHIPKHKASKHGITDDLEQNTPKAKKIKLTEDFFCEPCNRNFSSQAFYDLHCKNVHELEAIQCLNCDLNFQEPKDLNDHICSSLNKEDHKEFPCNKCDSKWRSVQVLSLHLQHDHEVSKPSICDICGLILSAPKHLQRHKKYVHFGVKHICDVCGKSYQTEGSLREHIEKRHEGNHNTKCQKCDIECNSVEELFKHTLECANDNKEFSCSKCENDDRKWNSALVLTLHLEIEHNVEKPVVCKICGQILSASKHLSRHMKYVHNSFRNICHLCGQGFAGLQYLREHIERVHEGSFRYQCDFCPFKCVKKRNLEMHINSSHTKSIKYDCPECEFTSFNKNARNNHIRFVHKKIRPKKCDICPEAFVSLRELQNHKARKHDIGVYVPQKNYHKKKPKALLDQPSDLSIRQPQFI